MRAQKHKFLSVEYVQPQWVYDSLNFRVVLPTDAYSPGAKPPPHVSPFVQDEDEDGYVPDYMQKLKQLQVNAKRPPWRRRPRSRSIFASCYAGLVEEEYACIGCLREFP